jgi:16S rRNA (guanine527-N7)-methyltransferase
MAGSLDPLRESLSAGLAALVLPSDLAGPLAELSELVASWASRMNLTGHRTAEEVSSRLVLDALALGVSLPVRPRSLADLGSGAGFPGLPLAVLWPACRFTLVEARERRHHFLRAAIRALGLLNATALRGRAEEIPAAAHEVVVAQAMAAPAQALEWMARWAAADGWLALPQASDAAPIVPPPGIEPAGLRSYRVPVSGIPRALWLGRLQSRPR